jgi:hypothetical protein
LANNRHDRQAPSPGITARFRPRDMRDKIYPDLERIPDIWGLFGGTFDDPNWFDRSAANCRHIFTGSAQRGVALRAASTPSRPTLPSWTAHRTHRPCSHIMWLFPGISRARLNTARPASVIKSSQLRVIFGSRPRATARRSSRSRRIGWRSMIDRASSDACPLTLTMAELLSANRRGLTRA